MFGWLPTLQKRQEANSQHHKKLTWEDLKSLPISNIKVGDLITFEKNQRVPADMVLIRTTEKGGN